METNGAGADWRDAQAYAALLDADRSLFAWEWLRRDRSYAAAALCASARKFAPRDFGLAEFERPELGVPRARPLWLSDVHPYVLGAGAVAPGASDDLFDWAALQMLARTARGTSSDHLLLSDGLRTIRLDGPAGMFDSGPTRLAYRIEGIESAERTLLTLRRFIALCRTGEFSRSLHPREARAKRWILMLRTFDALASGADQRTIAEELLRRTAAEPRWRVREPSTRSQAQRLAQSARRMAAGGYRKLLS